ncbi:MAG: hypothetical protein IT286_01825 [Proteobacteria bacterium]|jgi:hypothetical protein|nr:hypothetical protein [Pseudomonadota bacterium]
MRAWTTLVLILGLTACSESTDLIACTEEARSSVTLKIVDADTEEVLDIANVTYSVDGGTETTTGCTDDEAFVDHCGTFPVTYEVAGEFEITVSSPGYEDKTRTTTIVKTEDGCHVVGKLLTFKMNPL